MSVSSESFWESLDPFGVELGLDRMKRLLRAMGEPQRGLRILQVAGTNGKGSAAATAAALLGAAGHRVGLYTSPHLVRLAERIRVGAQQIDDAALDAGVQALRGAMARTGEQPTYFEALTAVALDHFARERVEFAVLEVGLGGRLDATSAVEPEVEIITRIGLDHMAILGPTLAAIAAEKAAIVKGGAQVFVARQPLEAREVIVAHAARVGATCALAGRDFGLFEDHRARAPSSLEARLLPRGDGDGDRGGESAAAIEAVDAIEAVEAAGESVERIAGRAVEAASPLHYKEGAARIDALALALAGAHQLDNAEVAIAAARALSPRVDGAVIRRGLREVRWPGRFEVISRRPLTLVDGAHNPDGARALAATCRARFPSARPRLVFSALADKDVAAIARLVFPLAASLHLVQLDNPRALSIERLAALARSSGVPFTEHPNVAAALRGARAEALGDGDHGWVLAAGSLYLVGEALRLTPQTP